MPLGAIERRGGCSYPYTLNSSFKKKRVHITFLHFTYKFCIWGGGGCATKNNTYTNY